MTARKKKYLHPRLGFPAGSAVKNPPSETQVRSLGGEAPLKKEIATHSSILAWETLWTEEPDRIQSTGSQRGEHNQAHMEEVIYK